MKVFKQLNICNFYIALWVIYSLHWSNTKIPIIESISNIVLAINLIISLYYTFIFFYNYRPSRLFKAIALLLSIFTLYGLFYMAFGETKYLADFPVKKGTYLISILRSFLPIFAFYIFTIKGYLTPKIMRFWSIVFLVTFIFIFYQTKYLHSLISSRDEFVNNTGYLFALIIPCVYYWKKSTLIQFIIVGVCFVFVLLALKRGAMLTTICAILMFLNYKFKNAHNLRKIQITAVIILAFCIAYSFVSERLTESSLLNERIEYTLEGKSSSRDKLAKQFINHYVNDSSIIEQVVGAGADATLSISFNYAHNDWIEILICQGIIGLVVYLLFWRSFFIQWRRTKDAESRMIIGSYFVIYFIRTFVSMSYSMILTIASMGIGYSIAVNQLKINNKQILK